MGELRNLIIKGIRESVPRSQNMAKAFDIQQGKDEGPANFFNKLKDQVRKYSVLNLDDPFRQGMLKLNIIANSWPDVAKKLQKNRKLERQAFRGITERGQKGLC
jgi:hypothetical protein